MDSHFLKEVNDSSGELNCIFRKIKFDVFGKSEKNNHDQVLLRNQIFNIQNFSCKSPIFLVLEPDLTNISQETSQSGQNNSNYNLSISIQVSPVLQNDDTLVSPLENLQGTVSKSDENTSENFTLFDDDENSGSYISNITTADSSPIIKACIQNADKYVSDDEEASLQVVDETKDQPITEIIQENKISKRLSSIKSSIKRQLTSNRYVDICKNPEWPFIKQTSKVFSKNEQVKPRSQKSKRIAHKGTEICITSENTNSNLTSKNSSRGRTRKWLESLSTLFDGVYTQRSTLGRSAGLGLFSDRHFQKNDIITEFVGWVIDRKEALRLRSEGKATHICDLVKPSLYLDGEKDPKPFIGGGSFANDGSAFLGGPGNNSKFWKWYDEREGRSRVFLKATQEIQPGEEIFVGYCKDYWLDFAEKDSISISDKTNNTRSKLINSNKTITAGKKRGRKRSINVLKSIDNLEISPNSTIEEKCSSELVPEKITDSSLNENQNETESKRKRKSLYWDTVFNWSTSDDDEGNK